MLHFLLHWHWYNPQIGMYDQLVCGNCICWKESGGYTCRHSVINGRKECGGWS
jgi:hypothetical protein